MRTEYLSFNGKDMSRSFYGFPKDDYGEDIKNWLSAYEDYREKLDLKALQKLSYKEIKKKFKIRTSEEGYASIGPSCKIFSLSMYYDSPDSYYFDVFSIIKGLKYDMQNTEGYYDFRYSDGELGRMSCIHFLFNMIMWFPFFTLGLHVTRDLEFKPKIFTNDAYTSYLNEKLIEPYKHLVTMNQMSNILARMYDLFILISENTALYLGLSFSLYDLLKRWETNPELKDINHTVIPQDMSIAEGEAMLNAKAKRFQEIMMNEEEGNQFKILMQSGQANAKQTKEFAINISYKPDLEGRTLNTHPSTNFVSNGLRDPVDYVTDACGGRKASNLALQIDDAGYLQRTLCKSAADLVLSPNSTYDCGSKHYYVRHIETKKDLDSMVGRYYVNGDHLTQLVATDYELIGKTLKFRSPATCACGKKGICHVCYGHIYNQNVGINIGINSALKLAERFYQNLMSAKHILATTTASLAFNDEFYIAFAIEDGFRAVLVDDEEVVQRHVMKINKNTVYSDKEEFKYSKTYITEFKLYDNEEETMYDISETNNNKIYLSERLFGIISELMRKEKYDDEGWMSIPLSEFDETEDIFFTNLDNAEITRPLKELKSMIEKGREIENVNDISDLINKLNRLMREGGIHTESVHVEIIARNLIRDRNNIVSLPDYSKSTIDPVFISIHNSILTNNSVVTSLTFERIHQQLRTPSTYNKNGISPYDRLFIND